MDGVTPDARVRTTGGPLRVVASDSLKGRVLDGIGRPLDGKGRIHGTEMITASQGAPSPLTRARIDQAISSGVRSIDCLLTVGKGQRLGIFAGSGVGKSTLLGMMARNSAAHVNVIALVGERGREVREFIERDLGEEGMERSVVVAATSDQPPLVRIKGAFVATAIAEHFRARGLDVILMMDSLTRLAYAQRELGLAIGEPPTTRGYTPSVFALLPKLLERSGTAQRGSITGIYTVLVEGDDMNEPIADASRAILDGHIVLSRSLTDSGHFPPVDILASVSRLMPDIVDGDHYRLALAARQVLSDYRDAEDLVNIGAYVQGSSARIDRALSVVEKLKNFLCQGIKEKSDVTVNMAELAAILDARGT
jgi:flagellum-specific ATP synthase